MLNSRDIAAEGEECESCQKGNSMYAQCIRLDSDFGGACGNCKRGDRGYLCTIRDVDGKLKLDNNEDNKMVKRDAPRREGLRTQGDAKGNQKKYSK